MRLTIPLPSMQLTQVKRQLRLVDGKLAEPVRYSPGYQKVNQITVLYLSEVHSTSCTVHLQIRSSPLLFAGLQILMQCVVLWSAFVVERFNLANCQTQCFTVNVFTVKVLVSTCCDFYKYTITNYCYCITIVLLKFILLFATIYLLSKVSLSCYPPNYSRLCVIKAIVSTSRSTLLDSIYK